MEEVVTKEVSLEMEEKSPKLTLDPQTQQIIVLTISKEMSQPLTNIQRTVDLLEQGNTIPFVARYRKEQTGSMDEVQIRIVRDRLEYLVEVEKRKITILTEIEKQGKLTDPLRNQIKQCIVKQDLEDLYLPYKPKRRTKATIAKEAGLEPLADLILAQQLTFGEPLDHAKSYINPEKNMDTAEKALEYAGYILAENIANHPEYRKAIRQMTFQDGFIKTKVTKDFKDKPSKFEVYYDYSEPISKIPAHRFLAIRRAEKEEVITIAVEMDKDLVCSYLEKKVIKNRNSIFVSTLVSICDDAYHRLIQPSIETEIWVDLKEKSDEASITVFSNNLYHLLLQPPYGNKWVLAIDPGFRTGSKVVVINDTGKMIEHQTIYPIPPQNQREEAVRILKKLAQNYPIELVVIGNGTASREIDAFMTALIKENVLGTTSLEKVVANESGASVYSASDLARKEFPDLDVTIRGAISIGRRVQDPLAELVKIDPKSIGVGQYQHDVNQRALKRSLDETVQSCVNFVGVDLNTASQSLLSYVAGIGPHLAQNIVTYRDGHGKFQDRQQLLSVSGFGPKAFEQSAGFLRIRDGKNPLDASAVHPERYKVVNTMLNDLKVSLNDLMGNQGVVKKINLNHYVSNEVGLPTLEDILEELQKPGRDPRVGAFGPKFDQEIQTLEDLKPDMKIEGVITNLTNFGVFVDIGVHQDGLVHVSEISNKFIKDPAEVCKVGQIVTVKVLEVDKVRNRIKLSMKQA